MKIKDMVSCTVREALDENNVEGHHLECEFNNGEKYSAIVVEDEELAYQLHDLIQIARNNRELFYRLSYLP